MTSVYDLPVSIWISSSLLANEYILYLSDVIRRNVRPHPHHVNPSLRFVSSHCAVERKNNSSNSEPEAYLMNMSG